MSLINKIREKLGIPEDWKKFTKSYSFLAHAGNILQAVSITGLSVLGVISYAIALKVVVCLAIFLGFIGLIGRLLPQNGITSDVNKDEQNVSHP